MKKVWSKRIAIISYPLALFVSILGVVAFASSASAASTRGSVQAISKNVVHISSVHSLAIIAPLNSAGCTGYLPGLSGQFGWCIAVDGTGLNVSWVKTSGFTNQAGCSVAELLVNGNIGFSMPQVCYTGGTIQTTTGTDYTATMLSADFVLNKNFKNGTVLCEQYQGSGIPGGTSPRACETIES